VLLRRALSFASASLALGVGACGVSSAPETVRSVFLDFAEGTEKLALGEHDDASHDVSQLCASSFARWEAPADCAGGDREDCRYEVLRLVREHFAPYAVEVTLSRPASQRTYTTVVIAPPNTECSFGRRGVAFADCHDENPANIAMVFDCHGDAASCAVLVAHETAHTFGLVHSADPLDIMTLAPEDASLRFRSEPALALESECGMLRQSSHDVLLQVLGPRRETP
jgi:hypothetical protein